MQERTAFRLAMLTNGYWPLLNDCKKAIETGWPKRRPDEAEILSWDRSALLSTGLKLDGDLAVIDVDVSEAALVDALAGALDNSFPELFARGLVRHAGGPKEAWIARVDEPFRRLASRRWYRGSDPDDPAVPKHMVECFGSLGTRQFAIDGPHTPRPRGRGDQHATSSPAAPRRRRRRGRRCRCCRRRPTRWPATCSTRSPRRPGSPPSRKPGAAGARRRPCVSSSTPTPRSRRTTYGAMTVAELERLMRARKAGANAPATLRCSGSFHDPTRVRTDSHLINWGRYGLGIYDTMTETTWHRRERAPSARFEFLGQLQARNPFQ